MLDHYLHTAYRADELLNRHRDRPFTPADASPGVTPESPADQKQALAWFESEHAVLLAVLRQATGFDTHIWQLAWALASFFEYQGHWRDWRDSQTHGAGCQPAAIGQAGPGSLTSVCWAARSSS